ncbi:MAG TPA: chloride channel protein [Spirochaetota bacterium]|nr:chloride channel protein [Spirochaetota bacterium]HNT10752.1 chloride channel protein [Spirochaetota bacterium]HOS41858.1 chloride channel protein [Spirochaetota bacterium]
MQPVPDSPNIATRLRELYVTSEISHYIAHAVLSAALGAIAGMGALAFHFALERIRALVEYLRASAGGPPGSYIIVLLPIIGGILCAAINRFFPKIAREKGVLSVIKAIIVKHGLIPLRVTVFQAVGSIVAIGSGAPLGPEAPAAKIGSGIGSFLSRVFRLGRNDMIMYTAAGSSAAIAAVFNAPIAGVFFGIEVILLNDLKNRAISALIIAAVVASTVSRSILGNHHIFSIPHYSLGSIAHYPLYVAMGIVCGLISILYFVLCKNYTLIVEKRFGVNDAFLKLVPVCLVFGIILIWFFPLYGIGYNTINMVMNNLIPLNVAIALLMLKIVFLALFIKSGSYGGTFAPSLMIGALLGFCFATMVNYGFKMTLNPVVFSLIGMGGVLAGIHSIPLTAIMLVFEVTNDYKFILPLMLVSIISYLVTVYYNRGNVYTNELLEENIDVTKRGEVDVLGRVNVSKLMKDDFTTVSHRTPFRAVLDIMLSSKYGDVFVVDDTRRLLGVVSLRDTREALLDHALIDLLIAKDLITPVPSVTADEPVSSAMQKIEKFDVDIIPVVKTPDDPEIIGILTYPDIVQAYNTLLEQRETSQFLINYHGRDESAPRE